MRLPASVYLLSAVLAGAMPSLAAAGPFDGRWSVLIVTEKGDCDRAYRYEVAVSDGVLAMQAESGVQLRGRVADSGAVTVSVARGTQHADGTGRLTARGGGGRWQGDSGTGLCSGTWTAERR